MNGAGSGNTIITNVEETTGANGEFERFEALLSGLVRTPKKAAGQTTKAPATTE